MKHKLILMALIFSLVIVSQNSLSLGMGKIQVNSALDEPLNANIDIMANENEPIEQVSVVLANSADYKKVGLDKSFVPGNIMVSVDENNPYQINVTSNGPVSEPIVSLLLDVKWPNGRILREFTLLLDPQTYETSSSGSVEMPAISPSESTVDSDTYEVNEAVPADAEIAQNDDIPPVSTDLNEMRDASPEYADSETSTESEPEPMSGLSSARNEITVYGGDTLWAIANKNKVGDVTTQQMMVAIFDNNPQAFLNDNMNKMVKDSTLTMPSSDTAAAISYDEALAESKAQHDSWAAEQDNNYSSYQTEADDSDTTAVADTPDYGVQLSGGEGNETDSEQTEGVEVAAGSESMDEVDAYNVSNENKELKTRVSELENIVNDQQSVMELEDDDLANLETQLGEAEDQDTLSEGSFDEEDAVDADSDLVADSNEDDLVDDVWDSQDEESVEDATNNMTAMAENEDEVSLGDDDSVTDELVDDEQATEQPSGSQSDDVAIQPPAKTLTPASQPWYTQATNWIMNNILWVIIGLVVLLVLVLLPRLFNRSDSEVTEGGSFMDDIKTTRRKDAPGVEVADPEDDESQLEEDEETILTQPVTVADNSETSDDDDDLFDDKDSDADDIDFDSLTDADDSDADDDVLADLDNSLKFDDKAADTDEEDVFDFDFDDDDDLDDDDDDIELDKQEAPSKDIDIDAEYDEHSGGTPTKEYDPAPFMDPDDDSESDYSLDDLEEADDDADDATDLVSDDDQSELDEDDLLSDLDDLDDTDEDSLEDETNDDSGQDDEPDEDIFDDVLSLDEDDKETAAFDSNEEDDMDDESVDLGLDDLMDEGDVIETKLDLAKAYIEMGDTEGAKNLLDEVVSEGNDDQVNTAKKLLDDM